MVSYSKHSGRYKIKEASDLIFKHRNKGPRMIYPLTRGSTEISKTYHEENELEGRTLRCVSTASVNTQ